MGQRVEFPSNSHTCEGYFAAPPGKGSAVVVIQEWWGLVPHIEDLVERFAREGFLAIAPDLFHGKTTKSPDEAGKMLMELDAGRALTEISGAGAYLLQRPECSSKTYGVIGFCAGGALAKYTGTKDKNVGATVSFYGGFKKVEYEWANLSGPIMLIAGELDRGVSAKGERELAEKLQSMGKKVEVHTYPDADHAFFNDTRPEVYNKEASADAWRRTLDFFRTNIH
ncbi:MAG TPA: dienelactone hydrolase family protein [Thermoanaerobaculia bacterium]